MSKYRCVFCEELFEESEIKGKENCPGCDITTVVVNTDHDIKLTINWRELKLLAQWADNYSTSIPSNTPEYMAFTSILFRLNQLQPDGEPALTKLDEDAQKCAKKIMSKLLNLGMIGRDGKTIHKVPASKYHG